MISYSEKRIVGSSIDDMFGVIFDIESYPEFLPGWNHTIIRTQDKDTIIVDQQCGIGPICWNFTSQAYYRKPEILEIRSSDSPFKNLTIKWELTKTKQHCCYVDFYIQAQLSTLLLHNLLKSFIRVSSHNIISLFEQRVYSLKQISK